jgi:hypothetical protein
MPSPDDKTDDAIEFEPQNTGSDVSELDAHHFEPVTETCGLPLLVVRGEQHRYIIINGEKALAVGSARGDDVT